MIRQWIATRPATDVVEVVVSFEDTVKIPRFPKPDVTRPRNDALNESRTQTARSMAETLAVHRSIQLGKDSLDVTGFYQGVILERFWLVQALVVSMPLGKVDTLSRRAGVTYIRPNVGDAPPHHDSNIKNDPLAARTKIGSDHYYGLGLGNGWIALLDTGVRTSHVMLCGLNICLTANCETGGCGPPYTGTACMPATPGCPPDAGGDMDSYGHGTSSAAILAGNSRMGEGMRGVTRGSLDCFTVYGSDAKVRVGATVKGFEYAIVRLNQVIVAEMQDNTASDIADVSAAASRAYDAGVIVIAANGNSSYWGSGEPARSRRTLGVGAYDVDTEVDITGAWGLTVDERIKPDLQAPSLTETASNQGNDLTQYFGATSGATPYAAGAASLLRNWMVIGSSGIDPGQVYSHLLLSGDKVSPFDATTSTGVGKIHLPETGTSWWGKTWVSNSVEFVEIPIEVSTTGNLKVQALIWWPEEAVSATGAPIDAHNDIDIELRGPHGVKKLGKSRVGVFERVEAVGDAHGNWRLKIRSVTMRLEPQTVYWCVSAVPSP